MKPNQADRIIRNLNSIIESVHYLTNNDYITHSQAATILDCVDDIDLICNEEENEP